MGAWGIGNFENDAAHDWQDEFLESAPKPPELSKYFDLLLNAPCGDSDVEQKALAAAEVLAGLRGRAARGLPEEIAEWISASRGKLRDEWRDLAVRAVHRATNDSELLELWTETDDLAAWIAEQRDLVARLTLPARKNVKRPRGPKLLLLRKTGQVVTYTYVARDPNLPDLESPEWQIESVRFDVSHGYALRDYQRLSDWLAPHSAVAAIFDDGKFGDLWETEYATWDGVLAGIRSFSKLTRTRLELSRLKDLAPLVHWPNLEELRIRLSGPFDFSGITGITTLKRFGVETISGNLFDENDRANAPRFDLAVLNGVAATYVDLRGCRLANAPASLSALHRCDTLLFDFWFEEGIFEMPSLASFVSLKRLHFLAVSSSCLVNALQAPALEKLFVFVDRETLEGCVDLLKKSSTLTNLTIMLQESPLDGFNEDHKTMDALGYPPAQPEEW